jgi:hypothetical protein
MSNFETFSQAAAILANGHAEPWIITTASAIAGWTTHANWPRLLEAWQWWKQQGGLIGIGKSFFKGCS